MSQIRVVTDSLSLITDSNAARRYNLTVVPAYVRFEDHTYRLGVDIAQEEVIKRMKYGATPQILPPTADDFLQVYRHLNREVTQIISIHTSAHLNPAIHHAQEATRMLLGRCNIQIIDSLNVSAAVGVLAEQSARIAFDSTDIDRVIREIRQLIPRLYSIFFVENMQTICERGLMSESQAILGTMFGIMPFLTIEDGQLYIMEKVRNYTQAVDKIVEYAVEFTSLDRLVILSHASNTVEPVRLLQDRLMAELPYATFSTHIYGAMLASLIGTDATGIAILEGEEETFEDDF